MSIFRRISSVCQALTGIFKQFVLNDPRKTVCNTVVYTKWGQVPLLQILFFLLLQFDPSPKIIYSSVITEL